MTAVRHPNGTYTDEYRAALFAGPQALERFYQSTVPSPRLEAEPTRGRPQAPAPAPAAPPSRPPHRPRLLRLRAPISGAVRRAPYQPPPFQLRGPASQVPRRLLNSGTHLYGFMQAAAPLRSMQDVLATWQQHLQVQPSQVLLLPIEICAWLLTHQPVGAWTAVSVWPSALTLGADASTGLDTLSVQTSGNWGVTTSGHAYFTPDGEVGSGENAAMVVSAGQPALIQ